MRVVQVCALVCFVLTVLSTVAQENPPPQTYSGLEISISGIERAATAALSDCPAGANAVRAMSRPGEGFAIVTVRVKVLPSFEDVSLGRPMLTNTAGELYYTAAAFVDTGSEPEYSCGFPFRIPDGTALKSIRVGDAISFDLTSLDTQMP